MTQQQQQQQQQQRQGATKGERGPLSLLKDTSPSRLLYSLMIVEHLLDRDMSGDAAGGGGGGGGLEQHAVAAVTEGNASGATLGGGGGGGLSEGKTRTMPGVTGQQPPPRRSGDNSQGGGGGRRGGVAENGDCGGAWKVYQPPPAVAAHGAAVDFITGCGGVGVGVGVGVARRTWRDRFVSNGGIDTLV